MSQAIDEKTLYEVMFLVDPAKARQGEKQTTEELGELVSRAGGELVNLAKWADRELAYAIHKSHQKFTRAVYFLGHFNGGGDTVTQLERLCHNLDWIARSMIIRDEDGPQVPGETPTKIAAKPDEAEDKASEPDAAKTDETPSEKPVEPTEEKDKAEPDEAEDKASEPDAAKTDETSSEKPAEPTGEKDEAEPDETTEVKEEESAEPDEADAPAEDKNTSAPAEAKEEESTEPDEVDAPAEDKGEEGD